MCNFSILYVKIVHQMFHTLIMKAGSFLGMQRERETHTRTGSCGKNMINFLSILAYTERERERERVVQVPLSSKWFLQAEGGRKRKTFKQSK